MWRLRAPLALLAGRASADWTHAEAEKILGTTTVSDAPALEHGLSTCDVEMIQIEDRPAGNNYWTKSMVINAHVAARHVGACCECGRAAAAAAGGGGRSAGV